MKKRVAAAVLGIMLSVSMGLEVPAAALDSGFESGFTSEQAADVQTEDGAEAVQPSGGKVEAVRAYKISGVKAAFYQIIIVKGKGFSRP